MRMLSFSAFRSWTVFVCVCRVSLPKPPSSLRQCRVAFLCAEVSGLFPSSASRPLTRLVQVQVLLPNDVTAQNRGQPARVESRAIGRNAGYFYDQWSGYPTR